MGGVEARRTADLKSPETYVGYARAAALLPGGISKTYRAFTGRIVTAAEPVGLRGLDDRSDSRP